MNVSHFPNEADTEFTWASLPMAPWTPSMWPVMGNAPQVCDTEIHPEGLAPQAAALEILWHPTTHVVFKAWMTCVDCHTALQETYAAGEAEEKAEAASAAPTTKGILAELREETEFPDMAPPASGEIEIRADDEKPLPLCPPCNRGDCEECMTPDHPRHIMYRCDRERDGHRKCPRTTFAIGDSFPLGDDYGIPGADNA